MSVPRRSYDPRRVCLMPLPSLPPFLRNHKRSVMIYLSGALFAIGWWLFIDACILSSATWKRALPPVPGGPDDDHTPPPDAPFVSINFADWVPGLCGTLGMIVVNLIDKSHLTEDGFSFGSMSGGASWSSDNVAWRARLYLFLGFALLAGGLAGSLTVLVIKYLVPAYPAGYDYYGLANVGQNAAIMLSTVFLWSAQSAPNEYEYNLTI
ncbi:UPF0220-domain-containing protein [Tilletiaria anomala UBC 951]|uniref:UPF0220-domain-containing protein n=1 Tax=Tilletiaria anomala (strain ATCC 24038 / CBS 436.72 / UBC 951) TaxID=1037660 RepID=A0A066W2H9_TILAU|nr:UPF0220-domain-containing protein [Tilletiaria anomala UBC 951]KDN48182.1 UPF0220-domain-containing protein [Tilletiaria anomala UBC 951]